MIRIGVFSELTGISIPMLRHYDKIGLLLPSYIDQESGYRFYEENQIVIANQIQVLKRLGFGLQEIKSLKDANADRKMLQGYLEQKVVQKKKEMESMERQIKQMREAIVELGIDKSNSLSVVIKEIPARDVVYVRGTISRFEDEGTLWRKLQKACVQDQIMISNQEYSYAITHNVDLKRKYIEVEVQLPVSLPYAVTGEVKQKHVASCKAVVFAFQGKYARLNEISPYMSNWMKKNGYRQAGPVTMIYYRSPGNEKDPEQFITEACYPIEEEKAK